MGRGANPETHLMQAIREALAVVPGVVVWRNNVGAYGPQGAKIFYGLAPGSADLVGVCVCEHFNFGDFQSPIASGIVLHNGSPMTRMRVGRFFALEVKTPGGRTDPKRAEAQDRWGAVARKHGGFYAKVTSVEDALAAVGRCRAGSDS